jgi:hypothetical protein
MKKSSETASSPSRDLGAHQPPPNVLSEVSSKGIKKYGNAEGAKRR